MSDARFNNVNHGASQSQKLYQSETQELQNLPHPEMKRVQGGGSRHPVINKAYLCYGYYDVIVIDD